MKYRELTDELIKKLDIEETADFNHYINISIKIFNKSEGERYIPLQNLLKKIEKDQSSWMEYKDILEEANTIWFDENYHKKRYTIDNGIAYMRASKDIIDYIYVNSTKNSDGERVMTRSELLIFYLASFIINEIRHEEEWLGLEGKIIPTVEIPKNIVSEYTVNNLNKSKDKETKEQQEISFEDFQVILKLTRYKELSQQIMDKPTAVERIKPLENLLRIIETNHPDFICTGINSDGNCNRCRLYGYYIDNDNDVETKTISEIGYKEFVSLINNPANGPIIDENDSQSQVRRAKFEIIYLYAALKTELRNNREEAMIYGVVEDNHASIKYIATCDVAADHFSMSVSETALKDILFDLKKYGWVAKETKDDDWIFRLTGRVPQNGKSPTEPIVFTGLNKCYYIVKNFIFKNYKKISGDDWDKAKKIFSVPGCNIDGLPNASKKPSGSNFIDDAIKSVKN